jgi:hypothetical protein
MTLNTLETGGNAMSCKTLSLQAKAQHYQIGCQSAEADDGVMLTKPIDINEKWARVTIPSLAANPENAKHAAEKLRECVEVWFAE